MALIKSKYCQKQKKLRGTPLRGRNEASDCTGRRTLEMIAHEAALARRSLGDGRQKKAIQRFFSGQSPTPIVELREYMLHPSDFKAYLQHTCDNSALRKSLPLSFFGTPETGGRLNTALHLYNYRSHSERLLKRSQLASNPDWHLYLEKVKCSMIQQSSEIYVEATSVTRKFEEVRGLQHFIDIDQENEDDGEPSLGIVEMRKYELQLGYDTVPKFLDIRQN